MDIKPYYETELGKLYNGDCLDILPAMDDKSVDCVVTSPPYNLVREWSGGGKNTSACMTRLESRYREWYDDAMPEVEYQDWQKTVVTELCRVCCGSVFYNHKVRYAWKRRGEIYHPLDWLRSFPLYCEIIWDRGGAMGGGNRRFLVSDERIHQFNKPKVWNKTPHTTVWRFSPAGGGRDGEGKGHVCPFPVKLPMRCIKPTTLPGDTVLDPFLGSGTTAVACEKLGRRWIGIEISKEYCDIAVKRIEAERSQLKLALN